MVHPFTRTEMLIGKEGLETLRKSKVVVLGVGGVGSYVVEALARSGIGHMVLCDNDTVCITNINRQIHALPTTVDQIKVEAMRDRVLAINPEAVVEIHPYIYNDQSADRIIPEDADYVVDAIDMVSSKLHLVEYCQSKRIPIMASMGTGNKLNPAMLEVADIFKTSVCPLAKVMRSELRKRGVKKLKVVYSKELPLKPLSLEEVGAVDVAEESEGLQASQASEMESNSEKIPAHKRRATPGSISFVPSVAGLIIASEVVKDLLGIIKKN